MKQLPENLKPYNKTPVYNENTIPKGLSNAHVTKDGTWGKICIIKGNLNYIIETNPVELNALDEKNYGVVEPQVPHHVEAQGEVEFFVEFYK